MEKMLSLRLGTAEGARALPVLLLSTGTRARTHFQGARAAAGVHLLLGGDRDYHVRLQAPSAEVIALLRPLVGTALWAVFPGRKPVRRVLAALAGAGLAAVAPKAETPRGTPAAPGGAGALDLTAGLRGAPPLFLLPDGRLSQSAAPPPVGISLLPTLVTAARWVSSRRTSTFERLFPDSAFHPDEPSRGERLSPEQGAVLLGQLKEALAAAAPVAEPLAAPAVAPAAAPADGRDDAAAQLRSAAVTVLSHLLATVLKDPAFRAVADGAAEELFAVVEREGGPGGHARLRAHTVQLLSLRGPALQKEARDRAGELLRGLLRQAPPYDELPGPWRFAMCSAYDFHEGECDLLRSRGGFTDVATPADAPKAPGFRGEYKVLEAPFRGKRGQVIQVFSRVASPADETFEMGQASFTGVLINRHAQLGSFDMQASATAVKQVGYKLMMNSQCAGLTTRFAISKAYPEADIYSSWDSTYFNTGVGGKVTASEGLDCFLVLLTGMSQGEDHAALSERMREAQWSHPQARFPGFSQFIGPAHPAVVGRFSDVNQDGRADFYDGFLDFQLQDIAEDLQGSAVPKDPGIPASQVGGAAARGLGWAAGSLNRVTQYSDLWEGLPGGAEILYPFQAAGFFSAGEPPRDVPLGAVPKELLDLGRQPAVCRYLSSEGAAGLQVDVMFHSHLSHAAEELKRLLCAAEALRRALDLGTLSAEGILATPLGQRGALLLMLAGLLEFPADQNFIDGLWSMALQLLNLPPLSRTLVRGCITEADHGASNYYGSMRGLRQLIDAGGALEKGDAVAFEKLKSDDPLVGRALPLTLD